MPIFSRCSDNSDPVLLTSWLARSPRLEPLSVFSMVILRQAQGISGHVDQFQFDGSNDQHRLVLYEIRETEILWYAGGEMSTRAARKGHLKYQMGPIP